MGVITYVLLAVYTLPLTATPNSKKWRPSLPATSSLSPQSTVPKSRRPPRTLSAHCDEAQARRKAALEHKWLVDEQPHVVTDTTGASADLLHDVKKAFNTKQLCALVPQSSSHTNKCYHHTRGRKATSTIKVVNRMTLLAHAEASGCGEIREVNKFIEESDREIFENANITYQVSHDSSTASSPHPSTLSTSNNHNINGVPPATTTTSVLLVSIVGAE
ncbi:hypothetical protein BDN70DRAFT_929357 [Pholiota conissans]|uniref:Uncharacterized protein n=1 Tax=Pholiota conissans TaxID=109636 RepID=A0A9P5ZCC9_9AGAR|nr:hypothetical protein BDN70DRAFT_929357 [Pholiota conissans]